MVLTRSQRKDLADSVQKDEPPGERLGRGCRERRPTQFFEDEAAELEAVRESRRMSKKPSGTGSVGNSSDEGSSAEKRRYPLREAAVRAVARMHNLLDDEDEGNAADERPAARAKGHVAHTAGRLHHHSRHRHRERSIDSSAIASDESEEENDGYSTDTSGGIVDDKDTRNATEALRKKLPLTKVVDNLVRSNADRGHDHGNRGRSHHQHDSFDADAHHDGRKRPRPQESQQAEDGHLYKEEALGDITPLPVDSSITFASVGGLPHHIIALREMIMIPLLYPQLLQHLGVRPPRGVLFVGPPGTGKTLMARAVANECQRTSQRKVNFFMRKGADILSKWVGESEKQLRILFDEARKRQPSIIFFDEIDGLAPVRHSKQEQSHAALVSTLLALLDGLDDRGQVVVIGATNRPDTIDPALRRPGRFDRELRFPVPDESSRKHIVKICVSKMKVNDEKEIQRIEDCLVKQCEGWTGADIQGVCTEATLHALRTRIPQIFVTSTKLKLPALDGTIGVSLGNVNAAVLRMKPLVARRSEDTLGASVPVAPEHLSLLLRGATDMCMKSIENSWGQAAHAATNALCDKTDDMEAAVRTLNRTSIPTIPRGCVAFIVDQDAHGFGATEVAKNLVNLAHFPSVHVAVPRLFHGTVGSVALSRGGPADYTGSGGGMLDESGSADAAAHSATVTQLFAALRSSSPSVLYLDDCDTWIEMLQSAGAGNNDDEVEDADDAHAAMRHGMSAVHHVLRYELMAALRGTDLLIVIPVAERNLDAVKNWLLGETVWSFLCTQRLLCAPTLVPQTPATDDRARWVTYLWNCAEIAAKHCGWTGGDNNDPEVLSTKAWQVLPVDDTPPPPSTPRTRRAEKEQRQALWRRVEYKRRQLRHILSQWLSQFVAIRKFQVLLDANLDLTEDHPLWKDWQKHTKGRRIGIHDVLEKLENEEYVCLSQYVADIEQICNNVRTFFTSRSTADQKYRSRAVELKETTTLNLYKIHKNVTAFCEEHKDLQEVLSSSSEQDEEPHDHKKRESGATNAENSGSDEDVVVVATSSPKKKKKRPIGWRGPRRSRKKQRAKKAEAEGNAAASESGSTETQDPNHNQHHHSSADRTDSAGKASTDASPSRSMQRQSSHSSAGGGTVITPESKTVAKTPSTTSASTASGSRRSGSGRSGGGPNGGGGVAQRLFNTKDHGVPPLPTSGTLNRAALEQWMVAATTPLFVVECHQLTVFLLRCLDLWRRDTQKRMDSWEAHFARDCHREIVDIIVAREATAAANCAPARKR